LFNGKKCIAVIPARKGSKRLKDKNIKLLNGKPLIAYTIEFAKKSKIFDNIIFSTDSEKYAEIAREYGAEVPFMRPEELARDNSTAIEVIMHSLEWICNDIESPYYYCYLPPTSPFRIVEDIHDIFKIIVEKNADAVVSVCECDHPIQWIFNITKDQKLRNFFEGDPSHHNRQDYDVTYRLNGAFYVAKIGFLLKNKSFYSNNTYAYIMPKLRSMDIDNLLDFEFAEYLLSKKFINL